MPQIRAVRTLNSVEAGTTDSATLQTLLTDSGRKVDMDVLCNQIPYARRIAGSTTVLTTLLGSDLAIDSLAGSVSNAIIYEHPPAKALVRATRATLLEFASPAYAASGSTNWWNFPLRTMPTSATWSSVTFGNGVFVAVANATNAATSPDGITWTTRTLPVSTTWSSVTFGNGVFVAVANTTNAATNV